jgi:cysteine-rich repeat protein
VAAFATFAPALPAQGQELEQACALTLRVAGDGMLAALELSVDYDGAGIDFVGEAAEVECQPLPPGAFAFENDEDATKTLNVGMISAIGVALPADFWRCTFVAPGEAPTAGSFVIDVIDALDAGFDPIEVVASVIDIACESGSSCGNGILDDDEECDDGGASTTCTAECRLAEELEVCTVSFNATSSTVLGGVGLALDYSVAGGEFDGVGTSVDCESKVESALAARNDRDDDQVLELAMLSPTGLTTPLLWECRFLRAYDAPDNAFSVTELSATDLSLADVEIELSVSTHSCQAGPVCGDGIQEAAEECDDGNTVVTDECTNACLDAVCGDGVVGPDEECDDANTADSDACTNACRLAVCGDSIVGPAEECDDGNTTDGDGCSASCDGEAACGDADGNGSVQAADALRILRNAVGQPLACPLRACDADGSETITAADALRILRKAVGQDVELSCPEIG